MDNNEKQIIYANIMNDVIEQANDNAFCDNDSVMAEEDFRIIEGLMSHLNVPKDLRQKAENALDNAILDGGENILSKDNSVSAHIKKAINLSHKIVEQAKEQVDKATV